MINERIKELMNQTGVPVSMPFYKWCEKFAELVVQECANYAFSDEQEHKAMLKHFGVEP